jgi:hypothetical protein
MSSGRFRLYRGRTYRDPGGFTLDPRSWWDDDPLLDRKPWCPALFWKYLIYLAVWDFEGHTVRRRGEVVRLERGQFYHSLSFLGKRPGWSTKKVRNELRLLEKEGRITVDPCHQGTLVTLLNYDPYQDLAFYTEAPRTGRSQKRTRNGKRFIHSEEGAVDTGLNPNSRRSVGPPRTRKEERTRNGHATNNNTLKTENTSRGPGHGTALPPPTSWTTIRTAVKNGFWDALPATVRVRMLLEAADAEDAPPDLEDWYETQKELLDPDSALVPSTEDLQDELRVKLDLIKQREEAPR